MDLRRLRAGEWIAALSGVVLLVAMGLPWYSAGSDVNAWQAFDVIDVVLAAISIGAISLVPITATQRSPAVPIAADTLVMWSGVVAFIVIVIRVIWLPDLGHQREWALWLALAAAAGIVGGGLVAMRDERLSSPGKHVDPTGIPIDEQPDIETLQAPRG